MHLVGAEDPFIRWPFLIEGAGIGCFGAIVSILCLQGLTELIQQQFLETMPFVPIILSGSLVLLLYLGIIIAGVTVGVLGAYLSVSRTLTRSVLPS